MSAHPSLPPGVKRLFRVQIYCIEHAVYVLQSDFIRHAMANEATMVRLEFVNSTVEHFTASGVEPSLCSTTKLPYFFRGLSGVDDHALWDMMNDYVSSAKQHPQYTVVGFNYLGLPIQLVNVQRTLRRIEISNLPRAEP